MKLDEMQVCAAETLKYFIEVMPDVPFKENDIVFEFAKKQDMAKRALEVCAIYCPEKIFTETQLAELSESIAANALVGREKSVVLVRINPQINKTDFRRVIVHELVHLFCAKSEMDGEHFIDIYGSGTTPEIEGMDKTYDGIIVAGYKVWTEFIAHYYAIKLIDKENLKFEKIASFVTELFHEVNVSDLIGSQKAFSMICSYWLNCMDFEETLEVLSKAGTFLSSDEPHGEETQKALFYCMDYIYDQIKKEKPWKITEDFIYGLGFKFSLFRLNNSQYLGYQLQAYL